MPELLTVPQILPDMPMAGESDFMRFVLARRFLSGSGLEVGALHRPLPVPPGVSVSYVDRYDVDGLREHYPELNPLPLVPVDVIDDGERLDTVADASQDFIIANHFLEHTQDPIRTLRRFMAVLKPGGVLYLAVPDKRGTFDRDRQVTPLSHLWNDYFWGPRWTYHSHMVEWCKLVNKTEGPALRKQIAELKAINYSIHFHVWTHPDFSEFLYDVRRRTGKPYNVEALVYNELLSESIAVLRRN